MIPQQVETFLQSIQSLASQYSDPSVILQHIPVLKDTLALQQNPEYLFYALGGVLLSVFAWLRFKTRKNAHHRNIATVIPQPYLGDADSAKHLATGPDDAEISSSPEPHDLRPTPVPVPAPEAHTRSKTQQLRDVSAISFKARPALTPDEARLRVLIQASLNEFGGGYLIMARTALSALLQPARDAVGQERAYAIKAIQDKYIDFGVFDRAGRCLVAIDVRENAPSQGKKPHDKSIVKSALKQARIPQIELGLSDTAVAIRTKLAPCLKATARQATMPTPERTIRPVRGPAIGLKRP